MPFKSFLEIEGRGLAHLLGPVSINIYLAFFFLFFSPWKPKLQGQSNAKYLFLMGKFLFFGGQQHKSWAAKLELESQSLIPLLNSYCIPGTIFTVGNKADPHSQHTHREGWFVFLLACILTHTNTHSLPLSPFLPLLENNLATWIKSSNIKYPLPDRNFSLQEIYLKELIWKKKRKKIYMWKDVYAR